MTVADTSGSSTSVGGPTDGGDGARTALDQAAERRSASTVLTVALLGLGMTAWHLGRTLWWFSDDWNILTKYHDGNVLEPFNGHLSLVPVGLFNLLFHTVGVERYGPYRALGLACYLGFGVVLYLYGRRQAPPLVAALGTLLLMWLSVAGFNLTFPFLINFTIPLAATIGVWWFLEHDDRRSDLWAAGCVALALASSGLGVVTVIALVVELALQRAPWRRWAPHVVPVGLWVGWYLGWSEPAGKNGGLGPSFTYARQEVAATFWAIGGTNRVLGVVAFLAVLGLLVAAVRWRTLDARALSALAAFGSFIVLTAYSRVGIIPRIPPDTGRYLWVNLAYLLVAVFACLRGRRLHPLLVGALGLLVVFNGVALVRDLRTYRRTVNTYADTVRVNLVAVDLVGRSIPDDRILPLSMLPVTVGDYRGAVADVGSPVGAIGPRQLGPESAEREQVDRQMAVDLGLALSPSGAPCSTPVDPDGEVGADTTVLVTAGDEDAAVVLRRLSGRVGVDLGMVRAGEARRLVLPADADPALGRRFPWTVTAAGASLTRCG